MKVKRKLREASLVLDSEEPVLGKSPGNTRGLNIRTPVYIGGLNTKKYTYAEAVGVTRGFTGCILQVWFLYSKKKKKHVCFPVRWIRLNLGSFYMYLVKRDGADIF